ANVGSVLVAAAAEAIADTPFEQLTRDRIFAPLGMTETAWKLADIDPAHLAVPYDHGAAGWIPYGQYGEVDWPDGELRSSVRELSRFLNMFIARGQGLLAAETVAAIARTQIFHLDPA